MPVITIPFDYDPRRYSASLVPIYLNDTDDNGEINLPRMDRRRRSGSGQAESPFTEGSGRRLAGLGTDRPNDPSSVAQAQGEHWLLPEL